MVIPDETHEKTWSLPSIEVIPETVGQFTGLYDKNGKEIYEWDIVEVDDFTNVYASKYIGVVEMRRGEWCVRYESRIFGECIHRLYFDDFVDRKTTIIGNIHDNPELLKN